MIGKKSVLISFVFVGSRKSDDLKFSVRNKENIYVDSLR